MNFGFFGITDILVVLLFIIAIILGFKKGFLQKFLKLASGIVGLVVAVIFCSRFADFLIAKGVFYPSIQQNIISNIESTSGISANSTPSEILSAIGFPSVIANYIGEKFGGELDIPSLAGETAHLFMVIISFLILLIGCWILTKIIKIIINIVRDSSKFVKIIDGILGVILYGFLAIVTLYILFFILSLIIQIPSLGGMRDFLNVDMQLTTDKFRLSKYFYENNILVNFFRLFF